MVSVFLKNGLLILIGFWYAAYVKDRVGLDVSERKSLIQHL